MDMEMEKEVVATSENQETQYPCKELFLQKCEEIHDAWTTMANRLKKDWEACGNNPYIKETTVYKVEVFRNREDQEPVDTFVTEKSQGFSLSTLLLAGGAALILSCCAPKKFKFLK